MLQDLSRRNALKLAVSAALATALRASPVSADTTTQGEASAGGGGKKVRIGFIGVGDRGTGLLRVALGFGEVEVPVVCDINGKNLARAQDLVEKARGRRPEGFDKGPHDYRRMLERDDFDAVLIATPQELHAEMSTDAMKAKKFVGSEVPACLTVDECHELVKVQKATGTGYMMLENYLYSQPVMMVSNMVAQGVFGELTYGYGSYIHEIRSMRFKPDGSLTWRGENILHNRGIIYPTHALGPVARWMGINVNDSLETLVAMDSKAISTQHYAAEKFGENSDAAKVRFENGDTNTALIRTKQGRLIEVRYDTASPRPPGMGQYSLQGSRGSFDAAFGQRNVFIEGKSPQHQWEPLDKYADTYEHPRWKQHGEQARASGHGGGDYFVIADFINSIRSGTSAIDVLDAVTWSVVRPLSEDSIRGGSKPVQFPDFSKS